MAEVNSHSVPIIWRLHQNLWDLNRESLAIQMQEAALKLGHLENTQTDEKAVQMTIGQLVASTISE